MPTRLGLLLVRCRRRVRRRLSLERTRRQSGIAEDFYFAQSGVSDRFLSLSVHLPGDCCVQIVFAAVLATSAGVSLMSTAVSPRCKATVILRGVASPVLPITTYQACRRVRAGL